jgi:hypothetical protein
MAVFLLRIAKYSTARAFALSDSPIDVLSRTPCKAPYLGINRIRGASSEHSNWRTVSVFLFGAQDAIFGFVSAIWRIPLTKELLERNAAIMPARVLLAEELHTMSCALTL